MKGILYAFKDKKVAVATFENGVVKLYNNQKIIGYYDTNGENIYLGHEKELIGHATDKTASYTKSPILFANGTRILNIKGTCISLFDGNSKGALAATVIYIKYLEKKKSQNNLNTKNYNRPTPAKVANDNKPAERVTQTIPAAPPAPSPFKPNVAPDTTTQEKSPNIFYGFLATTNNPILTILIGILGVAVIIYLAVTFGPWFWGDFLVKNVKEGELVAFVFYYIPLTLSYLASFFIVFKTGKNNADTSFFNILKSCFSVVLGLSTLCGVIGGIATIVDIIVQDMSKLNIILVIIFIIPIYWLISIIPAIVVSIATWIALKLNQD